MHGAGPTQAINCELYPGLLAATEPLEKGGALETPGAAGPGNWKHIRIEGMAGKVFLCFTEAHPGQDHRFRVGARVVTVPWDKFRLHRKDLFLDHEVTWE